MPTSTLACPPSKILIDKYQTSSPQKCDDINWLVSAPIAFKPKFTWCESQHWPLSWALKPDDESVQEELSDSWRSVPRTIPPRIWDQSKENPWWNTLAPTDNYASSFAPNLQATNTPLLD